MLIAVLLDALAQHSFVRIPTVEAGDDATIKASRAKAFGIRTASRTATERLTVSCTSMTEKQREESGGPRVVLLRTIGLGFCEQKRTRVLLLPAS